MLLTAVGCQETTVRGREGREMSIGIPRSLSIQRGHAQTLDVIVTRTNFNEGVSISVAQLPSGVTAEVPSGPSTAEKVTLVFRAKASADLVQGQTVRVTADGPDGMQSIQYFNLAVTE